MNVVFLKRFDKELSKIKDKKLILTIELILLSLEEANSISTISNVKRLKGYKNAYRIRVGGYRIGFYYFDGIVTIAAFGNRKEIYKSFP